MLLNKKITVILLIIVLFLTGCTQNDVTNEENQQLNKPQEGQSTLQPFQKNNLWGFKDQEDNIVIEPQYDEVKPFEDGIAAVEIENVRAYINEEGNFHIPENVSREQLTPEKIFGKYGYVNEENELVIPPKFLDARNFSDGLAAVKKDRLWGYIDKNGKTVIISLYEDVKNYSEGLAPVKKENKWGFINKQGNKIIESKFDEASVFKNQRSRIKIGNYFGMINQEGKLIISEDSKLIPKKANSKWGYVTKDNNSLAIYPNFSEAHEFSEGLALVREIIDKSLVYGYINSYGKYVIQPQYWEAKSFKDGIAHVSNQEYWGLIDKKGNKITKLQFDSINHYSDNILKVEKNGKFGLITIDGEKFIDLKYNAIKKLTNNLSIMRLENQWGLANKRGQLLTQITYDTIKKPIGNYLSVEKDNYWGYIDKEGHSIIEPKYDYVFDFIDGKAKVIKDNKVAVIDCQNNIIEEFKSIENFDVYGELTIETIEEMKTVIDIFISVVEPQIADQMINDLINFTAQQKSQLNSYARQYSQENNKKILDRVISSAINEAEKQEPELFNESPGFYNKEKFIILDYIDDKQVKAKMEEIFNNYLGVYFSEGDMSAEVDYLHINEQYGDYLTDEFSQYLKIKGENEDQPFFVEIYPRLSPEEVGQRLISYENFMESSQNIKLKQEIKKLYMHGLRPLIFHNKGTNYLNTHYQATFDYRMALDHLWKNEEAEVTSIAARDMLDFIYSREDFVLRTYTESSDMRKNYEKIETKISELLDERYINENNDE